MEGPQKAKNVCKGYVLLLYYSIKYYVVLFVSFYGLCFEVSLSDISIATPALFFFFHVHVLGIFVLICQWY